VNSIFALREDKSSYAEKNSQVL